MAPETTSAALCGGISRQSAVEEGHDGGFFRLQRIKFGAQVFFYLVFQLVDQITFEIAVQYLGVDVAFAADRRCIAEPG